MKFSIISTNDGIGFINEAGQVVIKQQFLEAQPFSDGLAAVKVEERWGFINHKGEFVIQPKYTRVQPFSDKLALVSLEEGLPIFIDQQGNVVIEPKPNWSFVGGFKDGLAPVIVKRKWGFINTKGEIAIEPKFDGVRSFSDGLAFVKVGADYEALVGYIDHSGKLSVPFESFEYKEGTDFAMNRAIVTTNKYNDYMLIDQTGKVIKNQLSLTCGTDFKSIVKGVTEGLLPVRLELTNQTTNYNGYGCGYIDMQEKIAIPPDPKIQKAKPFYEGLAAVQIKGKWGYINRTGLRVIEPKFNGVSHFTDGLAYVIVNAASQGFINHSGQFV
ncbi:MAG: WG repeat-containing protein [Nostoc sp.]|uniref:WG repeat-containing protein n=1 Tax=Nostoc sp. TaxID=1180 RepID=UPI002FF8A7AF